LFGIEMGEKGMQGVESGGKVPESSVSFGRRAVNEAKFEAPKKLSRSRLGAWRDRGRRACARGEKRTRQPEETKDIGGMFWGPLLEVLNIGDQGPSEGHRWGSRCCNARCIYQLETA
jgi:hypothetical protein